MFEHSDEYDFTPSASSNLASLFGTTVIPPEEANAALTYTAPKQPNPAKEFKKDIPKGEGSPRTKQHSTVICAKVITLYKPENGEWNLQGRLGLALVTIPSQGTNELIIYKEKNNIITRANINQNFHFTNQNDIFSSFFDNSRQNWLIKFETRDERNSVSEDIKRLGGNITNNVNNSTSPQNTTMKSNGNMSENNESRDDIDKVAPHSTPSKSYHEELDSDVSTGSQIRADILSRMAKMGQSILPGAFPKQTQSADLSDSDTADARHPPKPHRKPRKLSTPKEKEVDALHTANMTLVNYPSNHQLSNQVQTDHILVNQPMPTFSSDSYLIENKVRDTEIKLNLCEISTKLDYLIKSVNPVSHSFNPLSSSNDDSILRAKIKALELHIENLKFELQEYDSKYCQLLNDYETAKTRTKQETTESKEHNSESNEEIRKLEEVLRKTKLELLESNKVNEETVEKYEEKVKQLEQLIEMQETKIKELEEFHIAKKEICDSMESAEELKLTITDMEAKISNLEEYYNKNEEEKQKQKTQLSTKQSKFSEDLKQTMNITFDNIMNSFADKPEYSSSEIEAIIAQNIKKTTFRIIKHFEELK